MKVTKKRVLKQLDVIATLQNKLSISVQELERMLTEVRGTDVNIYEVSGDDLRICEEGRSLPTRIEDILDEMEE